MSSLLLQACSPGSAAGSTSTSGECPSVTFQRWGTLFQLHSPIPDLCTHPLVPREAQGVAVWGLQSERQVCPEDSCQPVSKLLSLPVHRMIEHFLLHHHIDAPRLFLPLPLGLWAAPTVFFAAGLLVALRHRCGRVWWAGSALLLGAIGVVRMALKSS